MKIQLFHDDKVTESHLRIYYKTMDDCLRKILKIAQSPLPLISAIKDDMQIQVDLNTVYHAESVEKKVFVYTDKEMFLSTFTLQNFVKYSEVYGFVRISKFAVVNACHIKGIELGKDMKHIITLQNNVQMELSRSYRNNFFSFLDSFLGKRKEVETIC